MKGKRLLIVGAAVALAISGCASATRITRTNPLKENSESSYTILFKDNGTAGDGSSTVTTKNDIISSGGEYISSITTANNMYKGKEGYGIKGGTSSKKGELVLAWNVTDYPVKPTSIVANIAIFDNSKDLANGVYWGYNSNTSYAAIEGGATLTDYTLTLDGNTSLTSLTVAGRIASNARFYCKSITVNYSTAPVPTVDHISLSGNFKTLFTQGEAFTHEGMVVTATYSDNSTADVTNSATFAGYDMSVTGTQTVTVSYGNKTATYDITVNPENGLTEDDPLTVAEALVKIGALPSNGVNSNSKYYVEGYVTLVDYAWSSSNGFTFELGDTNNATSTIKVYKANGIDDNTNLSLKAGDKVRVFGYLQRYVNSSNVTTNEITSGVVTITKASPAVPEPLIQSKTIEEFLALPNVKTAAYYLNGTIKDFGSTGETNNKYGNMTLVDESGEIYLYGTTLTSSALTWINGVSYLFTNPQDFQTNDSTKYLAVGDEITVKAIRSDYTKDGVTTKQGQGVITAVTYNNCYTVSFDSNGGSAISSQKIHDSKLAIEPTAPTKKGYIFDGWYSDATLNNEYEFNTPVTADLQLFAKWSLAVVADNAFVKVTNVTNLLDGDYLIVSVTSGVAFDGSLETLDAISDTIPVTISGSNIAVSDALKASVFSIETSNGVSHIKSKSGSYIGRSASSNGLDTASDLNDLSKVNNTITFDNEGNAVITASGGTTLRYNSASNQNRFRYYTQNQQPVQLFRYVDIHQYLGNVTTFKSLTATENNGTVSGVSITLGASISQAVWEAIDCDWPITSYGLMSARRTSASSKTVVEAYNDGFAVADKRIEVNGQPNFQNGNYSFTAKINVSNYNTLFGVAPYIVAGGEIYFLEELDYSVSELAQEYLDAEDYSVLSEDVLNILAGN